MPIRVSKALDQCSPSSYYDIIVKGNENSSEAAYYLLKKRLHYLLKKVYVDYGFGLVDEFDDTINDYFLYLYNYNVSSKQTPFSILENIREKKAFFGWILSTYRIFLLNKAKEKAQEREILGLALARPKGEGFQLPGRQDDEKPLTDEMMMQYLANAIAFADQEFDLMKRFLFYRMILSFLNHRLAIPQEEMAKTLKLNAVTYRVYTKRQKDRFLEFINIQESGSILPLDLKHKEMSDSIMEQFEHLYALMVVYYNQTLEQLPNASEVAALRMEYNQNMGGSMHESQAVYGFNNEVGMCSFYKNAKAYLERYSS